MESQVVIRDYKASDLARIKEIHNETGIDYQLPDLNSPLFLVTKVAEVGGEVRAAGGLYIQTEVYLWLDPSDWADPHEKLNIIQELNRAGMQEAWLKGIDCACLWLPPGMERFGERLVMDLGFHRDREGWVTYSRKTKCE